MTELEEDEGLLSRWSRRKAQAAAGVPEEEELSPQVMESAVSENEPPPPPPSDEDMPPLESLTDESDYSGFLSPNVSEELRRMALRKLFSSAVFNKVDGLDDYDDDFTSFEPLGDIVTSDMKYQAEQEARRQMEALMEDEEAMELDDVDEAEPLGPSEDEEETRNAEDAEPVDEESADSVEGLSDESDDEANDAPAIRMGDLQPQNINTREGA